MKRTKVIYNVKMSNNEVVEVVKIFPSFLDANTFVTSIKFYSNVIGKPILEEIIS